MSRHGLGRSLAEQLPATRRRDVGLANVDESDVAAAAESHQELVRVNLEKSSTLQSGVMMIFNKFHKLLSFLKIYARMSKKPNEIFI